ncbi:cell adhesion molecule L1-like a [Chanos chanos]|uniref:Neural cell adhesion molecule L1 n=1 Tax=Chanos chanos TaxID=29144 RepID=A0A6J2UX79_CHACN|nr:neural cell adhesion molecule L1-like protein [Chanos chanos]
MGMLWGPGVAFLLFLSTTALSLHIPLEVEQPPTIIAHSPSSLILFPFDLNITLTCEAKGNPKPVYRWTKDGIDFNPHKDPRLIKKNNTGSFIIPKISNVSKYEGKYRCYASNKLGTALTGETEVIVQGVPKFPKEKIDPVVVKEGESVILECKPPTGVPPRQLYWMTIGLQHIEQNERVSMGLDGNLYFSNAQQIDSREDYCCFASFPNIRTIVQTSPMAVNVQNSSSIQQRRPVLLVPPADQSETHIVKGGELELECIAEGLPTPKIEWTKIGEKQLPKGASIENFGKLLTISKVTEEADGRYMCKAKNSVGETVHYFQVTVEEPPQWVEEPQRSQIATIGSDVHIKCSATGKPQPSINWKRNGMPLDDTTAVQRKVLDDTIVLNGVQEKDSAVYQCEASNRHGTILANANILIMNRPPLILTKDYVEYFAVEGGSVMMHCNVFSSPPATTQWIKDDPEGSLPEERFTTLKNGSVLLHKAEKEDIGKYICVASNSEGRHTISAELYVKDPTRIVKAPQNMTVQRGSVAELVCQAEYDTSLKGESEIVWEKNSQLIFSSFTQDSGYIVDNGLLKFINVSHSDKGLYTCIAKTPLDEDSASAYVTVVDVPDAPVDLTLSEQKNRSVKLQWVPTKDHNSPITEFVIEFEENHWEPGRWREILQVPGNRVFAVLSLQGHINYQFRVSAINAVGKGPPSKPSERYKTPPAVPDKNPENIKIQGHLPHQMHITWEPLLPVEHNAPDLEYKLSYRHMGVEDSWKEQMVKRHSFVVRDTPTFVPYEIKIQSHNSQGWGPEPQVVTGYSGEDFVFWHCRHNNATVPLAAPENLAVEVINSTLLRVSWSPVPIETVRGHLAGHTVSYWRTGSVLSSKKIPVEKQTLMLPGNRTHALIAGLKPFSQYNFTISVFNKRGSGPTSAPYSFSTPEGVPERVPILRATNAQGKTITLVWAPPQEANGVLTGYSLQYQRMNETMDVGDIYSVNITSPEKTQWLLQNLEMGSTYKFYLSACTKQGCGPPISEEVSSLPLAFPAPSNISFTVSDTYAKIWWATEGGLWESELYISVMNHRDGSWTISEAINSSQSFYIIEGLEPGEVYTVRLSNNSTHDNSSIHEEVFKTRARGMEEVYGGISSKGWFVGLMCAVALLTLAVLIACFVRKNKGGKYSVKEKEDLPDMEVNGLKEETSAEYSDDEKPLQAISVDIKDDISVSSGNYSDGVEASFEEDGSFIGEYTRREPVDKN